MAGQKKEKKSKNVRSNPKIDKDPEEKQDLIETMELHVSDEVQATVTTESSRRSGGTRSVCAMYKVVARKANGKKIIVQYNSRGEAIGDNRSKFQSYIGMLARTMVPIDEADWPNVSEEIKNRILEDIHETFIIPPESESMVLKSAAMKWRQFKSTLTSKYVLPYLGQKKKLSRPPRQYAFVGKKAWKKFVAQRSDANWLAVHKAQSERVSKRKFPHRLSRKGYIGLEEEELKSGNLESGEEIDRAILWKKARIPKNTNVDEEQAKINEKIDNLLEMKRKGEFNPSGSEDVLTRALETPEHSGRVRGVGSFVTPSIFFKLPKGKRCRVTKAELLARDRQRDEEMERTKAEIAQLKEQITKMAQQFNQSSPIVSSKASVHVEKEHSLEKPKLVKQLLLEDECVVVEPTQPAPTKPNMRACELAVDTIHNKVAFGMVLGEGDMLLDGQPLQPGCLLVSVDGCIKPDALLPCPIPAKGIENVEQSVGFCVSWPRELVIFASAVKKKKEKQMPAGELQRLQREFKEAQPRVDNPKRFNLLHKHATSYMKASGASIQIPCDEEVFGIEKIIFLLHENVIALLEFGMIGQSVICTYMMALHTKLRNSEKSGTFAFLDPVATFHVNEAFESYIVKQLKGGKSDRVLFLPHNENMHWILIIIWDAQIYILNPLPQPTHYPALEKALVSALKTVNAETASNKIPKVKHVPGCPKQPGGHECGYCVMRYMKDITEEEQISFDTKWAKKSRTCYTKDQLNEVRFECLDFILEHIV